MLGLLIAAMLAGPPPPDAPRCLGGAAFVAPRFEEEGRDASNLWLVEQALGLELRVFVAGHAPAATFESELELWLGDFVEEPGFRRYRSELVEIGGRRAAVRAWHGGDRPGQSWVTHAALIFGADRSWALTLLVPPGAASGGDAAFAALLASFRPGGC